MGTCPSSPEVTTAMSKFCMPDWLLVAQLSVPQLSVPIALPGDVPIALPSPATVTTFCWSHFAPHLIEEVLLQAAALETVRALFRVDHTSPRGVDLELVMDSARQQLRAVNRQFRSVAGDPMFVIRLNRLVKKMRYNLGYRSIATPIVIPAPSELEMCRDVVYLRDALYFAQWRTAWRQREECLQQFVLKYTTEDHNRIAAMQLIPSATILFEYDPWKLVQRRFGLAASQINGALYFVEKWLRQARPSYTVRKLVVLDSGEHEVDWQFTNELPKEFSIVDEEGKVYMDASADGTILLLQCRRAGPINNDRGPINVIVNSTILDALRGTVLYFVQHYIGLLIHSWVICGASNELIFYDCPYFQSSMYIAVRAHELPSLTPDEYMRRCSDSCKPRLCLCTPRAYNTYGWNFQLRKRNERQSHKLYKLDQEGHCFVRVLPYRLEIIDWRRGTTHAVEFPTQTDIRYLYGFNEFENHVRNVCICVDTTRHIVYVVPTPPPGGYTADSLNVYAIPLDKTRQWF